jgi:hypothetical protein
MIPHFPSPDGDKKTPLTHVRGEKTFHGTTLICPIQGHLMPSDNVDEPFRSSRTAPKWLLCGIGQGLTPTPSRCKTGFTKLALSSLLHSFYYTCFFKFVKTWFFPSYVLLRFIHRKRHLVILLVIFRGTASHLHLLPLGAGNQQLPGFGSFEWPNNSPLLHLIHESGCPGVA